MCVVWMRPVVIVARYQLPSLSISLAEEKSMGKRVRHAVMSTCEHNGRSTSVSIDRGWRIHPLNFDHVRSLQ